MVSEMNDTRFQSEVLQSDLPVLVDFWAPWCGPCRMVSPVVEAVAQELHGRIKVYKLNVDDNPRTASEYGIMSIPTLGIFKGGKMAKRIVGYQPKEQLKRQVEAAL